MERLIKEILDKENVMCKQITKATSGFTNLVYFVDDKYVIKMSNDEQVKKKLDKETAIYKNIKLNCIPEFVRSGSWEKYQYLIITKLKGNSLYSIWHTLSKEERQSCIKQIAGILKEFNKKDYDFLSEEYKIVDWTNYLIAELKTKLLALEEMGFDTKYINDFISNDLPNMFIENTFGFVYNDAHFDNFIYNNGKLSLIDFDRVRVCPIDYEMLIFKTMCDNPSKFASEEDEDKIKDEDYAGIYEQFKSEYPEMFKNLNIEKRIVVYQFNYLIKQAIEIKNSEWIGNLIDDFKEKMSCI